MSAMEDRTEIKLPQKSYPKIEVDKEYKINWVLLRLI